LHDACHALSYPPDIALLRSASLPAILECPLKACIHNLSQCNEASASPFYEICPRRIVTVVSPIPRNAEPSSVDDAEIARFAAMAAKWWDPDGECRPLHRLNPARLGFIRDHLAGHFERDIKAGRPFDGLSLVDIGCGGGLVSEPMTRLGFRVTGVDAAGEGIDVARAHAEVGRLEIDYRHDTAEALVEAGMRFDAVLALEVVEHVTEPAAFLASIGRLVRPGGAVVLSTLNRTAKAFALGIVGAEYVLRWVPRGTHHWRKFLKPSELAALARRAGLDARELAGLGYDAINDEWSIGGDLSVNYLMFATRPD
jgi:2-polyprenyl-6-hydroxyphenyl methylase/3-demethylubiquinone-9 3-methyltransferase